MKVETNKLTGVAMLEIKQIDENTVSINGVVYTKEVIENDEPLICTHDGYEYYLGPECPDDLPWQAAIEWCKNLGRDYELPDRLVTLAVCLNPETSRHLYTDSYYWTSTEVDTSYAWHQYRDSGYPGGQDYSSKSGANRVRAVRKVKAGSKTDDQN